jgi:hypothetical protein
MICTLTSQSSLNLHRLGTQGGGPPNDDEFEEIDPDLITEDTEDGERIADADRPPTPGQSWDCANSSIVSELPS